MPWRMVRVSPTRFRLCLASVLKILTEVEELGLVKKDVNGWLLTNEGGKICDDYLNKNIHKLEL